MAADRSRLAAALAYKQAEEERRRRMMESVPVPGAEMPTPALTQNFRRDLENLSIGIGEGLTRQLEGVKGIVTDPIGAAKGAYESVKAVVRDPAIIADALRYTAEKARSGPLGAGEVIGEMIGPRKGGPMMQELDVYHGTPHRFPATEANPLGEFDASKIGTGEGAQAYGHGIYYAESPSVAESYARMDSPFAKSGLKGQAATVAALAKQDAPGGPLNAAKYLADNYDSQVKRYGKADVDAAIASLQSGTLYKADLPDEMIDRMLDWDKPLSEQPVSVQKALMKLPNAQKLDETMTGAQLLESKMLVPGEMRDSAEASRRLQQLGITGIKYLDAGSRGQGGSGTRNFVVFPGEEKKVRILERK